MLGKRRASVLFALITVFIDVLGMGLVFPILPRLVQNLLGGAIAEASFAYGLLLAIYAVMQFFLLGIIVSAMARLTRSSLGALAACEQIGRLAWRLRPDSREGGHRTTRVRTVGRWQPYLGGLVNDLDRD